MKKYLSLLMVIGLLLLASCSQQSTNEGTVNHSNTGVKDGVKVMKTAVATSENRSLTKGLVRFAEIVENKSNGSINVEVYHSGQLGGDREVFEALQLGSIQGTTLSTGPIAQFSPRFSVFDLPYLFPNVETAYQLLDGPIGKELLQSLDSQNVVGLNYWENGFRHLTNDVKKVKTPKDVEGLKMRTLESKIHIDMWNELGANATPMAFTELFSGLQQGVVEGQENPIGNVVSNKFFEVQKYLTKIGHVYNASPFLVSKDFWDSLTDEEREIVQEAADEARDYQRKLNQEEEEEGLKILADNGMLITDLSDEEKKVFAERMKPIYEKYTDFIGEEFLNKVLTELERMR